MMLRTVLAVCLSFVLSHVSVAETTASRLLRRAEQGDVAPQSRVRLDMYDRVTYQDGSHLNADKPKGASWLSAVSS